MARSTRLPELEERIGYAFADAALLEAALTHSSALPRGVVRASEQLEFLGDAVLDLAIADLLLKQFHDEPEGVLSKCRSRLVCTTSLAEKSRELGIGEALQLGRGEERSGGREKDSILAAAYESVIGAIYRDTGFFRTRALVKRHFKGELASAEILETRDWKTRLQERTQARLRVVPEYRVVAEEGPAHARRFRCEVWVEGVQLAAGAGASKREAEQNAAAQALLDEDPELGG
jgi:ribonuclease-3